MSRLRAMENIVSDTSRRQSKRRDREDRSIDRKLDSSLKASFLERVIVIGAFSAHDTKVFKNSHDGSSVELVHNFLPREMPLGRF